MGHPGHLVGAEFGTITGSKCYDDYDNSGILRVHMHMRRSVILGTNRLAEMVT